MKHSTITDIFFDLDHTLWDFDKNSEIAFKAIFINDHPTVSITGFIENYIPINQACWKLYQYDKITHDELRYRRLKETFDAIGYAISDIEIEKIAIDYIEILPQSNVLFEGTLEILDYLFNKYNLHIITNGFANVQTKKIQNSGIGHYFQTVTNSEMAGVKKPNPIIYEHALGLANAQKEGSLMIGDCLEADVQGALDAGLDAIFFNEKKVNVSARIKQVNHLLQIKNYL